MNIKDIVRHFTKNVEHLFTKEHLSKAEVVFEDISSYVPQAVSVLQTINSIAPNKTQQELIALGTKYSLHVTPEVLADPAKVHALIITSAVKELQHLTPNADVSALTTAVATAYSLLEAKESSQ